MSGFDSALTNWLAQFGPFEIDPSLNVDEVQMQRILGKLAERLTDNYPFSHPVYAGQMLKPPHPIAILAYEMAMRLNPNNHALDGGPATAALEREVITDLCRMVGYAPEASLGHLTSSGTIANLEALWIARELHPGKGIASSAAAHYTHQRMCGVLGMRHVPIPADHAGRISLPDLEIALQGGEIGTVVVTLGTTGLGAVDDLGAIVGICRANETRVHVDGAYGGFYRLLAGSDLLTFHASTAFIAMSEADSIVIDPHKHGLQPYGCGSVLFRDASIGHFYRHDSPYTYFTSGELHLGEISLECSRSGAAAAALWATLRLLPLTTDGLGQVLAQTRRAAIAWSNLIAESDELRLVTQPDLDIVCFYPKPSRAIPVSEISAWTERIFVHGMRPDPEAIFLAKFVMTEEQLHSGKHPNLIWDRPTMTVLRSVLMKPEHAELAPALHARVIESTKRTNF